MVDYREVSLKTLITGDIRAQKFKMPLNRVQLTSTPIAERLRLNFDRADSQKI